MPQRLGTAVEVDASAGDGSTAVAVPAGCNAAVAAWTHWDGDTSSTLATLTLAGNAFTIHSQLAEGAVAGESGVGIAALAYLGDGSQTLAWTWSAGGARTEGGKIILTFIKNADIRNLVRAAGSDAANGATSVAVTLPTEKTDLLLAIACSFTPTNPALDGTVYVNNSALNNHIYDMSEISPGKATTTVDMTGEAFSAMAAISIRDAPGLRNRNVLEILLGYRAGMRDWLNPTAWWREARA